MFEMPLAQGFRLAPFFTFTEETFVRSYTQGHMGRGWLDRVENPSCARILTGDFCILAGDGDSPSAEPMILDFPGEYAGRPILLVCQDEAWERNVRRLRPDCTEFPRYAFKKDTRFDRALLQSFAAALPPGYRLQAIDETLYARCLEHPFSQDLVSQFPTAQDYLRRGVGFCVLSGDELAGGASSYTVYSEGIEIEIDVKESHRRKGLATVCGAALILECLDRGLYPSWDAANLQSVGLAEKLGYELDFQYNAFAILP